MGVNSNVSLLLVRIFVKSFVNQTINLVYCNIIHKERSNYFLDSEGVGDSVGDSVTCNFRNCEMVICFYTLKYFKTAYCNSKNITNVLPQVAASQLFIYNKKTIAYTKWLAYLHDKS